MCKITVITGHYGCGKTTLAVNLALKNKGAAIVDLDIVNPYFRAADLKDLFEQSGTTLFAPDFANTNLDVPSVQFDIAALSKNFERVIVDVGGDDAGAAALGRFSKAICGDVEMLYVINGRRFLTQDPDDAVKLMREIENAARMKHTAIVNNTNLGAETTAQVIENSREFAREAAEKAGLPIKFTAIPKKLFGKVNVQNPFPIGIFLQPIWEQYE